MDIAPLSQGFSSVPIAVDHSRLIKTDAASVRLFLRAYEQYEREVTTRVREVTGQDVVSAEAAKPIRLKYCVDTEWLESLIDLDVLTDAISYGQLVNKVLHTYLESKAVKTRKFVTTDQLDKLLDNELQIDMKDLNARSCFETLFVLYRSLMRHQGLSKITKDNEKIAVFHVLSAIRPEPLRLRPKSDLALSHY